MSIAKKTRTQKSYIVEELHLHNLLLDTREIFLHSYVDNVEEDPGVEYRCAATFMKNIRLLENINSDVIIIHQYSIGGDWEAGMAIFDTINSCQSHIVVIMHGIAASMGSIIPQAADTRIIMPNCCFMLHDGHTGIHPGLTIKQAKSNFDFETYATKIMMNIYVDVCKDGAFFQKSKSGINNVKKYIRKKLNDKEDWYLDASETVRFGFADYVFGTEGYNDINTIKEGL